MKSIFLVLLAAGSLQAHDTCAEDACDSSSTFSKDSVDETKDAYDLSSTFSKDSVAELPAPASLISLTGGAGKEDMMPKKKPYARDIAVFSNAMKDKDKVYKFQREGFPTLTIGTEILGEGDEGVVFGTSDPNGDQGLVVKLPFDLYEKKVSHFFVYDKLKLLDDLKNSGDTHLARVVFPIHVWIHGAGGYGYPCAAFERYDGALSDYIGDERWKDRADFKMQVGKDILTAVLSLHEIGVAHLDLKPANILVECPQNVCRAYVHDFGGSCWYSMYDGKAVLEQHFCQSPLHQNWNSDEYYGHTLYKANFADLYSLGLILFELETGIKPPSGRNKTSILGSLTGNSERDEMLKALISGEAPPNADLAKAYYGYGRPDPPAQQATAATAAKGWLGDNVDDWKLGRFAKRWMQGEQTLKGGITNYLYGDRNELSGELSQD